MNLTTIDENITRLTQAKRLVSLLERLHNTGYKSQYIMSNDGMLLSFNLVYKSKYKFRLTPIYDVEFSVKLEKEYELITNKSDYKHVRNTDNQFDYNALFNLIHKFTGYVEWREYVDELLSEKTKAKWTKEADRFACKVKDKTFTVDARVYNFYSGDAEYLMKISYDCESNKFAFSDLIRDVNKAIEEASVATIRLDSVEQIDTKLHTETKVNHTVRVICSSLEIYSEVLIYLRVNIMYSKVILEYRNEKFVYKSCN